MCLLPFPLCPVVQTACATACAPPAAPWPTQQSATISKRVLQTKSTFTRAVHCAGTSKLSTVTAAGASSARSCLLRCLLR